MRRILALLAVLASVGGVAVAGDAAEPEYRPAVQRAREWARAHVAPGQWRCLDTLWDNESHWSIHARTGRAYGIPQALPGRRMESAERPWLGPLWDDWREDGLVQVRWGLSYIRGRYGTPCRALRYQERSGWY